MELGDVHVWIKKIKEVSSEEELNDVINSWMKANSNDGCEMPLAIAEAIHDQYDKMKPEGRHRLNVQRSSA